MHLKFKQIISSPYRLGTIFGTVGVLFGFFAHLFNYNLAPLLVPGYEFFAAPGMFVLSFFSEEAPFKLKFLLFLSGQFLGYFCLSFAYSMLKQKHADNA
ncbi:hypothetical protein [Thalassotalea aquiviva]|uniref:hypothetical protein n=1 Tax=Thalassotalea aquiviva TaxID=3242415 RepID=UPI00352B2A86